MSSLFPELEQGNQPAAPPQRSAAEEADARALFAALAGPVDAPDDAEAAASRCAFFFQQPRNRVSRDGIAASVAVTGRFEKALGLPGALRSLKRLVGGAIEFVAEIDGELYTGGLVPPGEPCWKEGRSFGLSHRGELHPKLAEALQRLLKRYDGVPYTALAALVEPEPEDKHMLANDYLESVLYSYAPSVGWRRFFEGSEIYRGACGEHGGRVATIEHTDLECIYNQTPGLPRLPTFFATPAIEWDVEANPDAITLQTDIQDRDVVRGADILLDQALLSLVDHPNKPDRVIVQAGCTPEVTGMDVLHLSAPARKPDHGTRLDSAEHGALPPVAYAPPTASLDREIAPILDEVDLLVANSQLRGEGRSGRVEFGFPCFHRHALSERGWLGIDGWAFFVELRANRMQAA